MKKITPLNIIWKLEGEVRRLEGWPESERGNPEYQCSLERYELAKVIARTVIVPKAIENSGLILGLDKRVYGHYKFGAGDHISRLLKSVNFKRRLA